MFVLPCQSCWGWHQGRARRARRYFKAFPHTLWLTRTHFLIPLARMMDLFHSFCCPCLLCNSLIQSVCGSTSGVKRPKKKENPKQTPNAPLPTKLKQRLEPYLSYWSFFKFQIPSSAYQLLFTLQSLQVVASWIASRVFFSYNL